MAAYYTPVADDLRKRIAALKAHGPGPGFAEPRSLINVLSSLQPFIDSLEPHRETFLAAGERELVAELDDLVKLRDEARQALQDALQRARDDHKEAD